MISCSTAGPERASLSTASLDFGDAVPLNPVPLVLEFARCMMNPAYRVCTGGI